MSAPFASEDAFLAAITRQFPNIHPHMVLGRGDDCAILRGPETMALTTDLFIEEVHFRRAYFSPEDTGYKALLVNVSDIAAMGGVPVGFSLGLAGPPSTPAAYWEGVLAGMAGLAASLDLPLVGGDLNACAQVVLAVTLWGRPGPTGRLLTRGNGRPGDELFLVGEPGLADVGLAVLEALTQEPCPDTGLPGGPVQRLEAARAQWPCAVGAHLRPALRVGQGLALAAATGVRGLMDVSDGLARDLPRFLGPYLGAELHLPPPHPEVERWATLTGRAPALLAATGGEDYALLGACAPEAFQALAQALPQARGIGRISAKQGIFLDGAPLTATGFDHFQA